MSDFDDHFPNLELTPWDMGSKDVQLFGRRYTWVRETGKLTLQAAPTPPIRVTTWECCGLPRVL